MAENTNSKSAPAIASVATTQGNWKNGLFSCCDAKIMLCVNAMFCSPCVVAQTRGKLGNYICFKSFKMFLGFLILLLVTEVILVVIYNIFLQSSLTRLSGRLKGNDLTTANNKAALSTYIVEVTALGETYGPPLGIIAIIYIAIVMRTRMDARVKNNMPVDHCNDCLASCCCLPCAITQMAKEVDVSEKCMNMEEPGDAFVGMDKESVCMA
jgi:Cys-rich protein (TIGR01571 family)